MAKFAQLGNDLYGGKRSLDIVGRRRLWYLVSTALVVVSLVGLFGRGLNFGIEFRGGSEMRVGQVADLTDYEARAEAEVRAIDPGAESVTVTLIGDTSVRVQTGELENTAAESLRGSLAEEFGVPVEEVTSSLIGPSWGETVTTNAIIALAVFLVLVALVLAVYFRTWKMALAALVALLHDVLFTVGIYALLGIEVSPASVIGFLTILGYSIYDTIVVFDKVRENTEYALETRRMTYAEAANLAVNQTLVRSINTSVVALLPVLALVIAGVAFIGPGTLLDLSVALFVGIAVGTFSSIFIATPLLVHLRQGEEEIADLQRKVTKRRGRFATAQEARAATAADAAEYAGVPVALADPVVGADPVLGDEVGPETLPQAPAAVGRSGATRVDPADLAGTDPSRAGRPPAAGRQVHPYAQRGPRNQPKRPPRSRRG